MGYFGHEVDNNPLWGYKTEIKENIKNENWRKLSDFGITKQKWENALERVNKEYKRSNTTGLVTYGGKYERPKKDRKYRNLPREVREKCERWLEENRDKIEYRHEDDFVEFRYFQIEVKISNRGNPKNIRMNAWFKDH